MGAVVRESPENLETAHEILHTYREKSIHIEDLVKSAGIPIQEIEIAIKSLEKKGQVYVERNPRILEGNLRTDIRTNDCVHFDTFPSIQRRTLLYKTGVEYGDYTINHVLGCAHGCDYPCYAMQISKRYGRVSDYDDWMHPRIVGNALELLEEEIPKLNSKIQFVHLSFMTDPFMYDAVNKRTHPWIKDITLKIIKRLNQEDIKVTALTKGILPTELKEDSYSKDNEYGITLVSLDTDFHDMYEPFSPSALERIEGLERLHNEGLKTWASLEPYPTPNLVEQDLNDLLSEISFVDKIIFGKWNYYREVNGYSEKESFYTKCVGDVLDFCKTNNIQFHIKNGTPGSNSDTESLFSQE